MSSSILIGRLLSAIYLLAGLGLIVRRAHYRKVMENMIANCGVLYMGGIMAAVGGLLIVMYHNTWTRSWTVLITIIGWLALIKGVSLLVVPDLMLKRYEKMMKNEKLLPAWGAIALVLGAILGYFSWLA